jgi:hypothetical protein
MATKTATYSTILPDPVPGFDPYQQPSREVADRRQVERQYYERQPQRQDAGQHEPAGRHHESTGRQHDQPQQKVAGGQSDAAEKDQLSKHINSNKTLAYGLLLVVAILLIVIGYQAFHQRKLVAEAAKVQQNPATAGDDPPGQQGQPKQSQPAQPKSQPQQQRQPAAQPARSNGGSNGDAARNDKILRQAQQKTASAGLPRGQSAMSRRAGCTDADDRKRLATIIEGSEAMAEDEAAEQTRAIIAEQLRRDAENDNGDDDSLSTGSVDVVDADTAARRDLRRAEMKESPQVEDERDEALIEQPCQDDIDEDDVSPNNAQVVVLCSQILSHGQRAGQECHRECKPGKQKCERHLALLAKKSPAA